MDVVRGIVTREFLQLEKNPRYVEILQEISALQQPILDSITAKLQVSLQQFLGPSFKRVSLPVPEVRGQSRMFARNAHLVIDDGTPTPLERKGDGVKSLVAISLMTQALESSAATKNIILLLEEPESHLHPKAIHQLREVLDTLQQDRQIIFTTHCPALVNRAHVPGNIIVSESKANPAKSLEELRAVLGVRASDNLRHAPLVIVVEGRDDLTALSGLFSANSPKLKNAIRSGSIAFEAIGGASKLRSALSHLQSSLCNYYTVLDDDADGRRALCEAQQDGLATLANTSFIKWLGLPESELEDLYTQTTYADYFRTKYGVDVGGTPFKQKRKWSERIRRGLSQSGKSSGTGAAWPEHEEMADKKAIAELVAKSPNTAILPAAMPVIEAIISAIEAALEKVSS